MEETTNNTGAVAAAPAKPTFLKVLCILTFIGAPLGLIQGIMSYFTYSKLGQLGDAMAGVAGGDEAAAAMNTMSSMLGLDYGKISMGYLIIGLLNLLILVGALMMWMLKKVGFYLYAVGQVAIVGVMFGYIGGVVGGMMGIVTAIFAIAFIIMYALNLKHLK